MTPKDRRLRPIPLGLGTGRGGASRCQLLFLIEAPRLRPVEKWECSLPSPVKHSWRTCGSFRLDWAHPQDRKRDLVVLSDPSLSLFASLPSDPPSFPRAKLRTW